MKEDTFSVQYFNWDDGVYLLCSECNCLVNLGFNASPFEFAGLAVRHVHNLRTDKIRALTLSKDQWKGGE